MVENKGEGRREKGEKGEGEKRRREKGWRREGMMMWL
jgi:hypothetical protein